MKKQVNAGILLLFQFFFATLSFGQVSINNDGALPLISTILDNNSEDKGLLIPRIELSGVKISDCFDLRFQFSKNNKDISLQVVNFRITKIGDPRN
jgi:hypothetical protein